MVLVAFPGASVQEGVWLWEVESLAAVEKNPVCKDLVCWWGLWGVSGRCLPFRVSTLSYGMEITLKPCFSLAWDSGNQIWFICDTEPVGISAEF